MSNPASLRITPLRCGCYAAAFIVALFSTVHAAEVSSPTAAAHQGTHQIVFELTSSEPEAWDGLLNNIENVRHSLGESQTTIEVVAHGKGLGFLRKTNAARQERMERLAATRVIFAACENTMKRQNVTKEVLLPFATTVDSGVAEVVRKQEAGWSYLRTGG